MFERSSGYAGYRCITCGTWLYENEVKFCDCDRPPELQKRPPARTIKDEIEEYRNMPPATRKLITRMANALIDSGAKITFDC